MNGASEKVVSSSTLEILPSALNAEIKTSNSLLRALYLEREYEVVIANHRPTSSTVDQNTESTSITNTFSPSEGTSVGSFSRNSEKCSNWGSNGECSSVSSAVILLPPLSESSTAIGQYLRFRSNRSRFGARHDRHLRIQGALGEERSKDGASFTLRDSNLETSHASASCFVRQISWMSHPGWPGLIHVNDHTSPWYGGCFPFTVYFPDQYPLECPVLEIVGPWSSHPFFCSVNENKRLVRSAPLRNCSHPEDPPTSSMAIEKDATHIHSPSSEPVPQSHSPRTTLPSTRHFLPLGRLYSSCYPSSSPAVDSRKISLMSRILGYVDAAFSPQRWTPEFLHLALGSIGDSPCCEMCHFGRLETSTTLSFPPGQEKTKMEVLNEVDYKRAHDDVLRCSVTHGTTLKSAYVDYLNSTVAVEFLSLEEQRSVKTREQTAMMKRETCIRPEDGGRRSSAFSSTSADYSSGAIVKEIEGDKERQAKWIAWYGREFLPTVVKLPQ